MITIPTVLVLGAGASIPYGFPSGRSLMEQIHMELNFDINTGEQSMWRMILNDLDHSDEEIQEFRWELYYSQQSSVDMLLEKRPEFLGVGKHCIALSLIPEEDENWLLRFEGRDIGFYQYMFNKMSTHFDEFGDNKLSVITFNYDRSLEHYLCRALHYSYGKSEERCAEQVNKIPIIHVHGSLGPLPWQSSGGRPYEATYGPDDIDAAAKGIIVVSEAEDTSQEFSKAFKLISEAKRVYFLGCGYHTANLQRLNIGELRKELRSGHTASMDTDYHMMGTAFMLEVAEMRAIDKRWQIVLPDNESDSLKFLRKYALLG